MASSTQIFAPFKRRKMASPIDGRKRLEALSRHLIPRQLPRKYCQMSKTAATGTAPNGFVRPNSLLTEEQEQFYIRNGYLVVRYLVSKDLLNRYYERFREICDRKVEVPGIQIIRDVSFAQSELRAEEKTVNKLQSFENDEVLFSYCKLPQILKYVECFTGPDVKSAHTMLINKPPDPGTLSSRHPLHQDLYYFPFRPADKIVCSWTAMERVDKRNGCLVVLPGTHYSPLLEHGYPNWKGGVNILFHGVKDFDSSIPAVQLEMNAGDTVFFHPLLIHGSGPNHTTGFRKAISCHYASSHCYFVDVTGTVQETIEAETMAVVQKKFGVGMDFSYQDVWRSKARLVKGSEGTF